MDPKQLSVHQRLALMNLLAGSRPFLSQLTGGAGAFAGHLAQGMATPTPDVNQAIALPVRGMTATLPTLVEYTRRLQHALLGNRDPHLSSDADAPRQATSGRQKAGV